MSPPSYAEQGGSERFSRPRGGKELDPGTCCGLKMLLRMGQAGFEPGEVGEVPLFLLDGGRRGNVNTLHICGSAWETPRACGGFLRRR